MNFDRILSITGVVAVITLFILSVLNLSAAQSTDAYWKIDKRASIEQTELCTLANGQTVYRIIDYQTGKIIYVNSWASTTGGIAVTDINHK